MIITTPPLRDRLPGADTRFVPGREVRGRDGLYGGPCGISDMMGANPGTYEKSLGEARETALGELEERARGLGANAVVGVDLDYEVINNMLMVSVSGNADTIKG